MKISLNNERKMNLNDPKAYYKYIVIFCCAFLLLFTHSPIFIDAPHRDSGVFLYFGSQILNGDIPYKDLWDHKPPLIYYIDALGLLLTGGSLWGIWLIKSFLLGIASILGFRFLESVFDIRAAIISIMLFFTCFASIVLINYTEEWALIFQISGLYFFWKAINGQRKFMWFFFGVTFACSFLLKPNMIGIYMSIIVSLIIFGVFKKKKKEISFNFMIVALGAMSIFLPTIIYFYFHDSLYQLIDQVFKYNSIYSGDVSIKDKIISLLGGFSVLGFSSYITLIAWFFLFLELLVKKQGINLNNIVMYIAFIGFPMEIFLSTLSGRSYEHYYVPWLPISLLLIGYLANRLVGLMSSDKIVLIRHGGVLILVSIIVSLPNMIHSIPNQLSIIINRGPGPQSEIIEYIQEKTEAHDYVLMWGAEASINFMTDRKAPTKYVYQYPLYTKGYQSAQMVEEFLQDIQRNRPRIIVDASSNDKWTPPIDLEKRKVWEESSDASIYMPLEEMNSVYDYIESNYLYSTTVDNWDIYVKR